MPHRLRVPESHWFPVHTGAFLALLFCLILCACSTDPNVKKQKFLDRANQDFGQGKYAEALISYGRAIQVDPRFAEAHYGLAQTHMKMGSWGAAYQELQRTVNLQPENWKAQLDMSRLELAGGRPKDAKERSQLVLKNDPQNAD